MPDNSIIEKAWSELTTSELYAFLRLRTDVFLVEQAVQESELDDRDQEPGTTHFFLADGHRVTAYLRILTDDEPEHLDARHIVGRVVVSPQNRGQGLAQTLLDRVTGLYGHEAMMLHGQSYIVPLYRRFGFETFGAEFMEAGIPHIGMYRPGSVRHSPGNQGVSP